MFFRGSRDSAIGTTKGSKLSCKTQMCSKLVNKHCRSADERCLTQLIVGQPTRDALRNSAKVINIMERYKSAVGSPEINDIKS